MLQDLEELDQHMDSRFRIPSAAWIEKNRDLPNRFPSQYLAKGFQQVRDALARAPENKELITMRQRLTVRIALHDNLMSTPERAARLQKEKRLRELLQLPKVKVGRDGDLTDGDVFVAEYFDTNWTTILYQPPRFWRIRALLSHEPSRTYSMNRWVARNFCKEVLRTTRERHICT